MDTVIKKIRSKSVDSLAGILGLSMEERIDYLLTIFASNEALLICEIIPGVILEKLDMPTDERGWLVEGWRKGAGKCEPVMNYMSKTKSGMIRGSHEHQKQTDCFVFPGIGDYLVSLWDNRPDTLNRGSYLELLMKNDTAYKLIIPPGVVHGYKCITDEKLFGFGFGLSANFPDQYFAGENRDEPIDEIRHENDVDSPFRIE
jgi:dTDP-4-dehydrorhamnose 3,5-epimerase